MKTASIYALLALMAIFVNIAVQDLLIRVYQGAFAVSVAVAGGTLVGLVVKYVLDKRYIFSFSARDARHDGKTFLLYSLMGLFTTMVFWGLEFGFHHLFESKGMRYLGGIIGLAIGYMSKYYLDRRYVFRRPAA